MKKWIALLTAGALALSLAACGTPAGSDASSAAASSEAASEVSSETASETASEAAPAEKPTEDRSGAPITLPDEIDSIAVMAPSIAETVVDLGCGDLITAIDTQTEAYALEGVPAGLPAFDMQAPDTEALAALEPDVVFVSGVSVIEGENMFQPLVDMGVCIVSIPTSSSIAAVEEDITFLAACLGRAEEGRQIVSGMQAEIDAIAAIGETVTDRKTVYFEISAAPYCYSFGEGVFLNEMIDLIGAENVLAGQEGWLSVEEESVVSANPDVILTNVNYIEDPVGEILARPGWEGVTAVQNGDVCTIDNKNSSLPNENIVQALKEMAKAVYPDLYEGV